MASKKISQLISSSLPPLSGSTTVVYSGVTHQSTLRTLRQQLVDSGSHVFTGSQTINGDLIVSGTLTAQQYILSSSISNITTETISGSSNFGNTLDDRHNFTGSVNITGSLNLSGSVYLTNYLNVSGSGSFDTLHVGTGDIDLTGDANQRTVVQVNSSGSINNINIFGNHDYYTQINLKNTNSGSLASGDIVVTADNGTEGVHYVDLGINSSTYNGGVVGNANDAYLLNVGKDLYLGTVGSAPDHYARLVLFSMNTWDNPQMIIDNTTDENLVMFNTGSVSSGYTYEFSGSAKIVGSLKTTDNLIVGDVTKQFKSITLTSSLANYPTTLYNSIGISVDNGGPHSAGMAVSTYTGVDGTNPVSILYGGGTGSTIDNSNQSILMSQGKVLMVKNTEALGTLLVSGSTTLKNNLIVTGSIRTNEITGSLDWSHIINEPTLVSGSSQIQYSGLTGVPSGLVSGSSQINNLGYAITGSNTFIGNQIVSGSIITSNISGNNNLIIKTSYTGTIVGTDTETATDNQSGADSLLFVAWISGSGGVDYPSIVNVQPNWSASGPGLSAGATVASTNTVDFGSGMSVYQITLNSGHGLFQTSQTYTFTEPNTTGLIENNWVFESGSNLIVPTGSNIIGVQNLATTGSNTFNGNQTINGSLIIEGVNEILTIDGGFTGNRNFDYTSGSVYYLTGLTGNGTWNINNVPTTNNLATTLTFVVNQDSTPYSASAYSINSSAVTVKWVESTVPTGSANKVDIIGLTAFRVGSSWNVLGSLSSFGS